tara:strand:- start:502 stop:687 length:186 start_codon:yes stop_codon:yes gene_type:complete
MGNSKQNYLEDLRTIQVMASECYLINIMFELEGDVRTDQKEGALFIYNDSLNDRREAHGQF